MVRFLLRLTRFMIKGFIRICVAAISLQSGLLLTGAEEEIIDLDDFVVWERERARAQEVLPVRQVQPWLGMGKDDLLRLPRSVTPVGGELMRILDIRDFSDLPRVGAGTQRVDYFGIAGSPILRGARAGTYFNGMLRAYQRNEMPTSFAAAEGLDLVRGPTPAHLTPTLVGGFVNMRPKEPFYDRTRSNLELSMGSWNLYRLTAENGGPLAGAARPAAWRGAFTVQRADAFVRNVQHDFESVYLAGRMKLNRSTEVFAGGEFYRYRSSENPGINRPTRQLIDSGRYVVGEPPDLTAAAWGGTVVRPLVEFPLSQAIHPSLHALTIPGPQARAAFPPEQLALLINMNDPLQLAQLYSVQPTAPPSWQQRAAAQLALLNPQPEDRYVYTPEFFAAGGEALTVVLPRDRTLSDPDDRANAHNGLLFANISGTTAQGRPWLYQMFSEGLSTDKYSTYGYASRTSQLVTENRLMVSGWLPGPDQDLSVGASVRFSYGKMRQDFFAEPFSRRDINETSISANSRVLAGDDRAPDGLNLWSPAFGANRRSQLYQAAAFAVWQRTFARLSVNTALRAEQAYYRMGVPTEVERADRIYRDTLTGSGSENWLNVALGLSYALTPHTSLYGNWQTGKGLAPADGGTIMGTGSFTDLQLTELGIKWANPAGTLFAQLSSYEWEQSTFSARDAYAQPMRGQGVEFELSWTVSPWLTLVSAVTAQRVRLRTDRIGFGAFIQDEMGWALNAGLFNAGGERAVPNNPDMVFAGAPEWAGHIHVITTLPRGATLAFGPSWRDAHWHDFGRNLRVPGVTTWFAEFSQTLHTWTVRARVDNLLDQDGWAPQESIFAAGTLISRIQPRRWQITVAKEF